jgi:ferrous iron transport protein A
MKIKDLSLGDEAVISGYEKGMRDYKRKLLTMGLTKGSTVKLVKVAPLGDPVELEIRGYNLSLRKAEADIMILEAKE